MAAPSAPTGPYRKPKADFYSVLLLVALLALIVGSVFLFLEVQDYGQPPFEGAPRAMQSVPAPVACPLTPPA